MFNFSMEEEQKKIEKLLKQRKEKQNMIARLTVYQEQHLKLKDQLEENLKSIYKN